MVWYDGFELAQIREQYRAFMNTAMGLRVPLNVCKFLSS
jgi:hypothetical protein